jgi:uncharacterized protein (DUF433 family)
MTVAWPDYLPETDGERHFAGTRLTPWIVLHFYNGLGYSAEMLALEFPSLSLPVIHKFIAFYLENAGELDALAASEQAEMDAVRETSPDHATLAELRKRLVQPRPISA